MKNKHRVKDLGLPPMKLAETVNSDEYYAKRETLRVIGKTLKIILLTLITVLCVYILYVYMSEDDEIDNKVFIMEMESDSELTKFDDKAIKEERLIAKETDVEDTALRKKREVSSQGNVEFKTDEEALIARDVIANHNKKCKDSDKDEFCKELVQKLQSSARQDTSEELDSSDLFGEDPESDQFETEPWADDFRAASMGRERHFMPNSRHAAYEPPPQTFYPMPQQLVPTLTDTCLLARLLKNNPQHVHAVYNVPVYSGPQYVPTSYIPAPHVAYPSAATHHAYHPESRIAVDVEDRMPHPQDAEIMHRAKLESRLSHTTDTAQKRDSSCGDAFTSCSNGECIPSKQWCDGVVDCTDVSDESQCSCVDRVDTYRLCDGYFDCPSGEDELGCYGCAKDAFSCEDLDLNSQSTCFTKEQRCNNIADCPNHKDEADCNLLSSTLHEQPMYAVSNTEGFLQRNFKGDWYPVCENPYMWAHDACRRETGLIIRPPFIQNIPVDPLFRLTYLNASPSGILQPSEFCANSTAVYVTCPDLLCGTRVLTTPQLLRENEAFENKLFGRNKRFLVPDEDTVIAYFPNRFKRYAENITAPETNDIEHHTPDLVKATSVLIEDTGDDVEMLQPEKLKRVRRAESRVVGGKPSQPAAWPWMIAMYRDGKFHCGGVVITDRWILSAAHCVTNFWEHYYEIQIGMLRRFSFSPQEHSLQVTHVILNRHYDKMDMKNDLSLLRVKPAIKFSRWVRPICLPNPETAGPDWLWGPAPGTICIAAGWGATEEHGPDPDHIREVEVPVWGQCKHKEDKAGREICAGLLEGGKDACQGDSGGPLLCRNPLNGHQWFMAGIVSHGDGCGRKGEPGVYTRVSMFVKWIKHHIFSKKLPEIQPKQECPGFRCRSGVSKCLPKDKLCDRVVDCLHGEDEYGITSCAFKKKTPKSFIESFLMGRSADEDGTEVKNMTEVTRHLNQSHASNQVNNANVATESYVKEHARGDQASTENDKNVDTEVHLAFRDSDITEDWSDIHTTTPESTTIETTTMVTHSTEIDVTSSQDEPSTTMRVPQEETTVFSVDLLTKLPDNQTLINKKDSNSTEEPVKESKGFSIELPLDNEQMSSNLHPVQIHKQSNENNTTRKKDSDGKMLVPAREMVDKNVPDLFTCTNIFQRIPYNRRCDRKADCEDGSDEIECRCVDYIITLNKNLFCDGVFDCSDGEDEHHCFECDDDRFLCQKTQMCLKNELVCDGKLDCPEGDDELDCYALTNGTKLMLEFDGRPSLKLEGYVTKKRGTNWNIVCEDNLTVDKQQEEAVHICQYLGFSSANRYLVKYVNVKDHILRTDKQYSVMKIRRDAPHADTYFTYRSVDENNNTKEVEIRHPQLLKEECVPNVTKTCMSLYVFCERTLFDPSLLHLEVEENLLARSDGKTWPWTAKVYFEGNYKCTGVLIDDSWVLVASTCVQGALLHHDYITVILGSQRTLRSSHGPYEQIMQVDHKKEWYSHHVTLLHLKEPVHYSHMVKPMMVSSLTRDGDMGATCVAIGQDRHNNTISVFLKETYQNCHHPKRCFERITKSPVCEPGTKTNRRWSGVVSCHSKYGWHPSASFNLDDGECFVNKTITAHDIGNLKSDIKEFLGTFVVDREAVSVSAECEGHRCARGRCLHMAQVCDEVWDCEDGSDEKPLACHQKNWLCSNDPFIRGCECASGELKCKNGKCISKKLFKDGHDDCGDGSDEPKQQSCVQYLALTYPQRLCDGIVHCQDKSDEDPLFCKCFSSKTHKCEQSDHCVSQDVVCDGLPDCPHGEDEFTCVALTAPKDVAYGTGMVIERFHGVWTTKCYDEPLHTRDELENICRQMGFLSGHAKQLSHIPGFKDRPPTKLVLDNFHEITLNNSTFKLRNTDGPLAKLVVDKNPAKTCYPVFIECI